MTLYRLLILKAKILFSICPLLAFAAGPQIDAQLTVSQVRPDGIGEATTAKPGDVLEYSVRYANLGNAPADALMPTLPIPPGTLYEPGDQTPPTDASLDGVAFGPIPLHRRIRAADGKLVDVEVPSRDYRSLRWHVGRLAAGAATTVRARVRIVLPSVVADAVGATSGSH